jgi:hypothetical protein
MATSAVTSGGARLKLCRVSSTMLAPSMTVDTGSGLEQITPYLPRRIAHRGLLLGGHPAGEVLRLVHHDAQEHIGVLGATVFRALAAAPRCPHDGAETE